MKHIQIFTLLSFMLMCMQNISCTTHRLTKEDLVNTRSCATSTVPRRSTTIWSSTTNSTTSRKPTAANGIPKKTSPVISSTSAMTLNGQWVISPTTLITNALAVGCLCMTIRWAQTTTCSESSDPNPPSASRVLPQGKALSVMLEVI